MTSAKKLHNSLQSNKIYLFKCSNKKIASDAICSPDILFFLPASEIVLFLYKIIN